MLRATKKEFIATDYNGNQITIVYLLKKQPPRRLPELITLSDASGKKRHFSLTNNDTFKLCGDDNTEYNCPELVAFIQQWHERT